jgi:hypothetical protein
VGGKWDDWSEINNFSLSRKSRSGSDLEIARHALPR